MQELKPCPFCGRELDITDGDSLYPNGMGCKDEGEYRSYHKGMEVPKEQWCYAAGCSELSGGCGAGVSGDNRQEAIDKWNARAIPDTHRIVSVEVLERVHQFSAVAAEHYSGMNDEVCQSYSEPWQQGVALGKELRSIIDKEKS
jgi:hypothetical protein